jgi:symplekin
MAAEDITSQLAQLDDARKLVLTDAGYYRQIIQGILPIIGPEAKPELRRWGADFLAETFANPTLPNKEKEELSLMILETLKSLVEKDGEDAGVIKSLVQCAASIYPLVFRWM